MRLLAARAGQWGCHFGCAGGLRSEKLNTLKDVSHGWWRLYPKGSRSNPRWQPDPHQQPVFMWATWCDCVASQTSLARLSKSQGIRFVMSSSISWQHPIGRVPVCMNIVLIGLVHSLFWKTSGKCSTTSHNPEEFLHNI